MATRSQQRVSSVRWGAVALVVAVVVGVGALVAAAYQHAKPATVARTAAPVPTFDLGVSSPTTTPVATPEPVSAAPRGTERFLAAGTGAGASVWWRATAGACGGPAPVLERSPDGGATWTDVTPLYTGAAQIAALDSADQTEAIVVVGVGPACEPQALRTFTQGEFWDSFPDVLAASRFVALTDPASLQVRSAQTAAPCADARGLRSRGEVAALVCDQVAYVSASDGPWAALPTTDAAAVAIDGADVLVAHVADDCAGVAVTRFTGSQQIATTCVGTADPTGPLALAVAESGPVLWDGDSVITASE